MRERVKETICKSMQILEETFVYELLRYSVEKNWTKFWTSLESLDKFLKVEKELCK